MAIAHAKPSYYDDGIILKGPSGVITKNGPIGPTGPAAPAYAGGYAGGYGGGYGGAYGGEGAYDGRYDGEEDDGDDGSYPGDRDDDGGYYGGPAYAGPAAEAIVARAGPVYAAPLPAYFEAPAPAYYGAAKGVAVRGPETVPALIAGPTGKILAGGLYSPPAPGYGYKRYYRR